MDCESFDDTVEAVYREVVAEAGRDPIKRQEAFDIAAGRIGQLILDGTVAVPHDRAVRSALLAADEKDGNSVDRVLAVLSAGQSPLQFDADPFLAVVATLGNGLRKSFQHITEDDMRDMDSLRYQNMHRAQVSYHRWRERFEAWTPCVRRHGTFGAAIAAGDVPEFDS